MQIRIQIPVIASMFHYEVVTYAYQHHNWCIANCQSPVSLNTLEHHCVLIFESDADAMYYKLAIDEEQMLERFEQTMNRKHTR